MGDNKGFTLVELIVTFAILAVVMIMVGAIIGMSSGTYKSISDDLNLQYEAQLAMSQIQEFVIDCSAYAATADDGSNDVLFLFNSSSEGEGMLCDGYKLALSTYDDTLMLYTRSGFTTYLDPADPSMYQFEEESGQPMSRNVKMFTAELNDKAVNITIYYELGRESYTGGQTIAFRNPVTDISSYVSG